MPIHRMSVEDTLPMTTTNELTNGNVNWISSYAFSSINFSVSQKTQTSDMNLSMEYEQPPVDSLPMDEDEEDDDEDEVISTKQNRHIYI